MNISDKMQWPEKEKPTPGQIDRSPSKLQRFFMHFLMPVAALSCGVLITFYLLKTGPEVRPTKRAPNAILVEVQKLASAPQQTRISGMGEIIPEREIEIKPQVSGEIVSISERFQLGSFFNENEEILSIDRTDYALVLQQLESELAKAESDLDLEMGNQRIAEREFALLGEEVSDQEKSLILRKPQLNRLKAIRDSVQAQLDQARLDLERTSIRAPFNGVIAAKMVDKGAKVSTSSPIAELIGTDSFWLKLTLPVDKLQWLKIPGRSGEGGSEVTIYPQESTTAKDARKGRVVRLLASLEEQGRMAQLLVKIDDPLSTRGDNRGKPQLLLGSYVRAEIEGVTINSGFTIDRANLHDGNTVWLMDDNGTLDIREVDVSFRGRDSVIITGGLSEGENLVISTLPSPIEGIQLRRDDDTSSSEKRVAMREDQQKKRDGRMKGGQ